MEFGKVISDSDNELLEFHTQLPALERLIADIQLNQNYNSSSNFGGGDCLCLTPAISIT